MNDPRYGDRTIEDMIDNAEDPVAGPRADPIEQVDGWRHPLATGRGFRHRYTEDLGHGGWDFYYLNEAVSLAVVDFQAAQSISRFHRHDDHLVFSAVMEGRSTISATDMEDEELAHGFCTFYGLERGAPVRTVYEPGRALRWVSIFLRCDRAQDLAGLDPTMLPPIFRDFICNRTPTGLRQVPLGSAASMAVMQILECPYHGELRRMFMIAKSIEIICSLVQSYVDRDEDMVRVTFTRADAEKVRIAKEIIEENLDDPLSVSELASAVGLTRQKLQYGFQSLFRSSVGRVYKQVRLSKAMSLVGETDMSMIEIALECGYEHPGSFTRAFKLAFGASPTLVRTMALQQAPQRKKKI